MFSALCPDCGEVLDLLESIRVGDRVHCVECGVELEVLSLYPLDLDYVAEDDWGDDWDDGEWEEEPEQEPDQEQEDDW